MDERAEPLAWKISTGIIVFIVAAMSMSLGMRTSMIITIIINVNPPPILRIRVSSCTLTPTLTFTPMLTLIPSLKLLNLAMYLSYLQFKPDLLFDEAEFLEEELFNGAVLELLSTVGVSGIEARHFFFVFQEDVDFVAGESGFFEVECVVQGHRVPFVSGSGGRDAPLSWHESA